MVGDRRAFDSLRWPQDVFALQALVAMRGSCTAGKPVRFWRGAPPGKAQLVEHSTDNREAVSSILTSRTSFNAEKMSWRARRSHKPPLGQVRFPPPQPWGR